MNNRIVGPRKVGGRYFCGYWRVGYSVTAIDGHMMTCVWDDGKTTTHCTAWDNRFDRVL